MKKIVDLLHEELKISIGGKGRFIHDGFVFDIGDYSDVFGEFTRIRKATPRELELQKAFDVLMKYEMKQYL